MDIVLKIDDNMKGFLGKFQDASNIAMVRTLNTQAALSRKNAIKNVKADFTNRNNYTTRQIQFEKATETRNTTLAYRAESRVGATKKAGYMKLQEEGGKKTNKSGSSAIAIGQRESRGGSMAMVISKQYYLNKMKSSRMVRGSFSKNYTSRKARTVARLAMAYKTKKFIKSKNRIMEVTSFSTRGNRPKIRTRLLYTVDNNPVRVKSNPWLEPATRKPAVDGPNIYKHALKKLFKEGKIV